MTTQGNESTPPVPDSPGLSRLDVAEVFDGGDMDCGSGLILLIRQSMSRVPVGGVLELRSREPTVRGDLPPWCRMVGHSYLGTIEAEGCDRHFVRRTGDDQAEREAFEGDKERAKAYEWRLRSRLGGKLASRIYCRNFSFEVGHPASFEEKDRHPSAIEYLLGAVIADLGVGFATICSRQGLEIDDVELTVKGRLENVLAHLGIEEGDPSLSAVELTCFASTLDDEARVRKAWEETLERSPCYRTLKKSTSFETRLAIV